MTETINSMLYCGGERGCGKREEGGLYACCATSPNGQPVEHFVIDPGMPFDVKPFRAPLFGQRADGTYDLIIWVGEEFYPAVPDFIEEARGMGVSRRISTETELDRLTPMKSRMVLVHRRTVYEPPLALPIQQWCKHPGEDHSCTYHTWPLSALVPSSKNHHTDLMEEGVARVTTPSVQYWVDYPVHLADNPPELSTGLFAAFPVTHLEYVAKKGTVPEKILENVQLAGYKLIVCEE